MGAATRSGILFCLIGPTGGGKTTFCKQLNQHFADSTEFSVSVTTRVKRTGEVEGQSYYFVDRAEFERRIAAGLFFEWEEVHGNLYGTLRETLDRAVRAGKDLLLDVDIGGALRFKKNYAQNSVNIFLVPPSFDSMVDRLKHRGAMSDTELQSRIRTARAEYQRLFEAQAKGEGVDYFLVNHRMEDTMRQLTGIVDAERTKLLRQNADYVRSVCMLPQE